MRDLFMTTRSFIKRLTAFLRYRRATHDMNKRYVDATVEDIEREDTCIICREEMRPWSVTNPQAAPDPAVAGGVPPVRPTTSPNERNRPKKLPCGHILHLGCLKSWLERQQVCPTCRNPVVDAPAEPRAAANNPNPPGQGGAPAPLNGQQDGAEGVAPPADGRGGRGMRMLNLGPLRLGFGQANLQDLAQGFGGPLPQANAEAVPGNARVYGLELGFPRRRQPPPQAAGVTSATGANTLQERLQQIEQQLATEIRSLQVTQQELQLVNLLQAELARLRNIQNGAADPLAANFQIPQGGPSLTRQTAPFSTPIPQMQRHGTRPGTTVIPSGSADLPPGVTIPEGWSLLPLQRLDGPTVTQRGMVPAGNAGSDPTATTTQPVTSPMLGTSNNTPATIPTINPENQVQDSSADSSDTNAIHTPPSIIADQSASGSTIFPSTTIPSTTSTITPTILPSDPPELPNWGTSQLSSDPTPTSNTSAAPPPPTSWGESSSMDVGHSSSISSETPRQDSEEPRRDKGKGRAPTVEDTVDEAEGA